MTLKVIVREGHDGYFVANCPSLRSCWSQGKTREEALENIREAIALYMEPRPSEHVVTAKQRTVSSRGCKPTVGVP